MGMVNMLNRFKHILQYLFSSKRLKNIILILSLSINIYFCVSKLDIQYKGSNTNFKYDARLSTFELNSEKTDVVFLDDSITAYIDWNEFFPTFDLLNRGIEGDTWKGIQHRLNEVVKHDPDIIVLMVGINDIAGGSSSEEILEAAKQSIEIIKKNLPGTKLILCDILPSPRYSVQVIQEVNTGYSRISEEYDEILYLPLLDLYLNPDSSVNAYLFSEDGVHLNGDGYSIWIEELRKIL